MYPGGADRIRPGKLLHKGCRAPKPQLVPQGGADFPVRRGGIAEAQYEISQVKARTPRYHRKGPPPVDLAATFIGQTHKIPGVKLLSGAANINKMVGNPPPFFRGRLGCADVHTPVNLHGVGGYHLDPLPGTHSPGRGIGKAAKNLRFTRSGGTKEN
jgi:hypothetical protein